MPLEVSTKILKAGYGECGLNRQWSEITRNTEKGAATLMHSHGMLGTERTEKEDFLCSCDDRKKSS